MTIKTEKTSFMDVYTKAKSIMVTADYLPMETDESIVDKDEYRKELSEIYALLEKAYESMVILIDKHQ